MQETITNPFKSIDIKKIFTLLLSKKYQILLFSFVVTSLVLLYALSIPNSYKVTTVFEKQGGSSSKGANGGLSALAGLAGISVGVSTDTLIPKMQYILNDYAFNNKIVNKYNLHEVLVDQNFSKQYVFAKNISLIYNLFNSKGRKENHDMANKSIKGTVKIFQNIVTLSSLKSGFITLSVTSPNRVFAKQIVDIYLKELAMELKYRDMLTVDKQINFYKSELQRASDIELKMQLSAQISELLKKKVLSNVNEYYLFDIVVESREPFVEEKLGPKRASMIIAAFLFSLVVWIAFIIAQDFLKKEEED